MEDTQTDVRRVLGSLQATFFERGWLSSNCVLFEGDAEQGGVNALVDSGYATQGRLIP